ncbi:MAG: methionyl-tRNA formyltransferase [Cytophagia bacterium]|nr:MAG: methionyl-tRNA formyltransferase [Cytophagia bacterium]TAG37850.1 MAG: methionyl-tRNA formyltransferase [Cytophagia bacterium]
MNKKLRIIFMGTPDFAVPSLEKLVENGFDVVAVITATDKIGGRGNQIIVSDVKKCALKYDLPILQPEKFKDEAFLTTLKALNADLQIVVAFRMLPEIVWNMPPLGTFNLHASLLPQYRGAAPINWAIINGEKETGLTTFFLKHEIDTGEIVFQEKITILDEDNVGSLYEKMKIQGADLLIKTVEAIQNNNYPRDEQKYNEKENKHAPKIFRENSVIDCNKSRIEIHNLVRGLSPYPCAWTTFLDKNCKIFTTNINTKLPENLSNSQDKFISDNKNLLFIRCADGYLAIEELQLEGKKRMKVDEFLRGNKI